MLRPNNDLSLYPLQFKDSISNLQIPPLVVDLQMIDQQKETRFSTQVLSMLDFSVHIIGMCGNEVPFM